jgi:Acyl-CoA carboxylase epsilon subunit
VSEANDPTTVSEANDPTTVNEANDPTNVNEANETSAPHQHIDIHVERGKPSGEEIAALAAVLAAAAGRAPAPTVQVRNMWGHPVDKLRYASCSWERVTLLERTHMRR